jgi:hypothetical protein
MSYTSGSASKHPGLYAALSKKIFGVENSDFTRDFDILSALSPTV